MDKSSGGAPRRWKNELLEVGPKVFAYVQSAGSDMKLGVYASWSDPERILPNVMRCYQEFERELHRPLDLSRMLDGMERLRGARAGHACL